MTCDVIRYVMTLSSMACFLSIYEQSLLLLFQYEKAYPTAKDIVSLNMGECPICQWPTVALTTTHWKISDVDTSGEGKEEWKISEDTVSVTSAFDPPYLSYISLHFFLSFFPSQCPIDY